MMEVEEIRKIAKMWKDGGGGQCPYPECRRIFKNNDSPHHIYEHIKAKHQNIKDKFCPKCSFVTGYSESLGLHIKRVHDKTLPYSCSKCKYHGQSKAELKMHFKSKHDGIREHVCSECDYASSFPQVLQNQMRHIHEKIKICRLCKYSTKLKEEMRDHKLATHEKDKFCSFCHFASRCKRGLKKHIAKKHPNCEVKDTSKENLTIGRSGSPKNVQLEIDPNTQEESDKNFIVSTEDIVIRVDGRENFAIENDTYEKGVESCMVIIKEEDIKTEISYNQIAFHECPVIGCILSLESIETLIEHLQTTHPLS